MNLILNFVKKHAILIFLIIAGASLGIFKFLKSKPKDKTASGNDVLINNGVTSQDDKAFYNKIALSVAHDLGTAYAWYDPRYLTENDQKVFNTINALTQQQFNIVSTLYFEVYAKGQTLSIDLARLLDDNLYKQLKVK